MIEDIRETFHSLEYDDYYASLDERIKVVKNLEGTEFYEARVSVGNNEYRTIVFAVESCSFIESKRIFFLNSFLKKGTKQYKGEIETARQILNKYIGGQDDDEV